MKKVLLTAMALLTIASASAFGMYGNSHDWIDFLVHGNQLRARMNQLGFTLGNGTIKGTFGFNGNTGGVILDAITGDNNKDNNVSKLAPTISMGIGYTSPAFGIGLGYNYTMKNADGSGIHTPVLTINALNDNLRIAIPFQIAYMTKEQQDAINLEGKNIIVSAGAGSGKTAVLTERTLRKLKSGIHINELLILTFTNAAAAEMKERIRKAINKNPNLEEEATLIDGAYITTFDSFSLSIVKKYHTRLNITSNIKITDEVIIDIKKNKILDDIMDKYYLSPKEDFTKLIQDFCLKDDKDLKKYILSTYKKIELKYNKEKYLEEYMSSYFTEENISKFIKEYLDLINSYRKNISNLITDLNDYFDGDYVSAIEDQLSKLLHASSYEEIASSLDFRSLKPVPKASPEEGKKIKETISAQIKELKSLLIYQTEEEMKEEILSTKSNVKVIIDIIKDLDKQLTLYKQENEIYNFNDIARLAIKVVTDFKDVREELTNSFNEILVDEYQDTSDTQEMFISLISKNNVYMVGDIKQSIYRFRNANPYIFKNKYDTYRDTDAGIKIDLVKNFRSRKEVLDNINILFDLIMDDEIGGADYKASHRMVFGNNTYLEQGYTTQDYNLSVLTYK